MRVRVRVGVRVGVMVGHLGTQGLLVILIKTYRLLLLHLVQPLERPPHRLALDARPLGAAHLGEGAGAGAGEGEGEGAGAGEGEGEGAGEVRTVLRITMTRGEKMQQSDSK